MDAQQIRDRAEAALMAADFAVAEDDANIPSNAPFPGGACLFIQKGAARVYLFPPRRRLPESADIAARALARAGLRALPEGADPAEAKTQTTDVLLGGTGNLVDGRDPSPGPLSEGWQDQHRRMLRSRDRLIAAANGSSAGSDHARDALYHFFQDAFHLKDWLKYDRGLSLAPQKQKDLEAHVDSKPALVMCADICNGVKHLSLDRPRIDGKPTKVVTQSVTLSLPPHETPFVYSGRPAESVPVRAMPTAEHQWTVIFDGQTRDAGQLANEVVAEWEQYLKDEGLL